jgi:hypothetical protein
MSVGAKDNGTRSLPAFFLPASREEEKKMFGAI